MINIYIYITIHRNVLFTRKQHELHKNVRLEIFPVDYCEWERLQMYTRRLSPCPTPHRKSFQIFNLSVILRIESNGFCRPDDKTIISMFTVSEFLGGFLRKHPQPYNASSV